jgi:hypothetical protein
MSRVRVDMVAEVGASARIVLDTLFKYLTIEVVELARNAAHKKKKKKRPISLRHIMLVIRNDTEPNGDGQR